jgi:hypothetical protein
MGIFPMWTFAFGHGEVVGRIFKVHSAPVGTPWNAESREVAMAAFANSWQRE